MEITYQLTKKQDFFQKNIGTFVKQKITPRVKEIDQAEEFPPEDSWICQRLTNHPPTGHP